MPAPRTIALVVGVGAVLLAAVGLTQMHANSTPVVRTTATTTRAVTLPPVNGRFDYQLGGPYAPSASVAIVDRDRTAKPVPGKYNVCYVNAFQTQAGEATFWRSKHADLLVHDAKGKLVEDPDWPGEFVLDTSTAAKRKSLAAIEAAWLDGCATAGFQAVEPDNLDSWSRSKGHLDQADNVAFAVLLAARAHADHLAIAQKNTAELGGVGRKQVGFDFAVAEECQVYKECGSYTGPYGNHVIEIEYTDNPRSAYTEACAAQGRTISVILRDRDVVPKGASGYHYEAC